MVKNIAKIIFVFALGIGGGIFADQILWPYFIERPLFYQYRLEQAPIYVTERKEFILEENSALQDAFDKVKNSAAGLVAETKSGKKITEGSAIIVSSDGLMITFSDLVPQGTVLNAYFNGGEPIKVEVLKRDTKQNLALISAKRMNGASTAAFGDISKVRQGQRVFLVGHNSAVKRPARWWVMEKIVNEGVVKTFDRLHIETSILDKTLIQGSPLFNIKGEAIGLSRVDSEGKITAFPMTKIREDFLGF